MQDVKDKILTRVRAKGRGVVYTTKDFLDLGSRAAVDQALSRLRYVMKIKLQVLLEGRLLGWVVLVAGGQQSQHMGRPVTRRGGVEMFQRGDDDHDV